MDKTILVTGGGGFLGTAICKKLLKRNYKVRSLSRSHYPHLEKIGVDSLQGSVLSMSDLDRALSGVSGIIHTAAKVGTWGKREDYVETNVQGTQNLLDIAEKLKVPRFVYTSSPSVVFGGNDICGEDESLPYPSKYYAHYSETKMLAEKRVKETHKKGKVATCSIRPHLIWGPGDPHFLPRLKEKAYSLKKVGNLKNKVDVTYIDNAAEAHVLALETLSLQSQNGGKAYFVGQEKPVNLWDFINQLLDCIELPPIKACIPTSLAYFAGASLEAYYRFRKIYDKEPPITRFVALNLGRSCYFTHKNAENDFDYKVEVKTEEGLRRLKKWAKKSPLL